jgi:hypothetical protein
MKQQNQFGLQNLVLAVLLVGLVLDYKDKLIIYNEPQLTSYKLNGHDLYMLLMFMNILMVT